MRLRQYCLVLAAGLFAAFGVRAADLGACAGGARREAPARRVLSQHRAVRAPARRRTPYRVHRQSADAGQARGALPRASAVPEAHRPGVPRRAAPRRRRLRGSAQVRASRRPFDPAREGHVSRDGRRDGRPRHRAEPERRAVLRRAGALAAAASSKASCSAGSGTSWITMRASSSGRRPTACGKSWSAGRRGR